MSVWNHRIMRRIYVDPTGKTTVRYGIVEAHYEKRGDDMPHSWMEEFIAPEGDTLPSLIKDFSQMLAALSKPILDHNGSRCEPATITSDELQQWVDALRDAEGEA